MDEEESTEDLLLPDDFRRDEWAQLVRYALTNHPDWAATTVEAVQAGILSANDRLRERIADVSMGLWQALSTRPGAKRRNRALIVKAIKSSNLAGSPWAVSTILKESGEAKQ